MEIKPEMMRITTKVWMFSLGVFLGEYQFSCNNDKDLVIWEEGIKLKWSDFQSKNFVGIGVTAASMIRLKLDYEIDSKGVWFKVQNLFYKKESTVRSDRTDYVLSHEQGHFDIGEVYARKIRKELFSIKKTIDRSNYQILDSVYRTYNKLMINEQALYDLETRYSNDTIKQKIWNARIQDMLDSLDLYKKQKY